MVRLNLDKKDAISLKHICNGSKYPFVTGDKHSLFLPNNGQMYVIDEGMKFDFASIPSVVMWLFSKESQGKRAVAYLVHDSMYINDEGRKFADSTMLAIMDKLTPNRKFANRVQYYGCRLFGWLVYYR